MNDEKVKKVNAVKGPSLRDRLKAANTHAEIATLLAQGAKFDRASADTQRKWKKAADARREYIDKQEAV